MLSAIVFGVLAAAALGSADFAARFTSLRLGAGTALAYVLFTGAVLMSLWIAWTGLPLPLTRHGLLLAALHGLSVAAMSAMLYAALARGPVSLAVPVVAAHPVLVLAFAAAAGQSHLSGSQIVAALVVTGGVVVSSMLAIHGGETADKGRGVTLMLALGACLAYAALLIFGQSAAAEIGEAPAAWVGRLAGATVVLLLALTRRMHLAKPGRSLPLLVLQGTLDTLGYLALLAGGATQFPAITAVVGSTFGFLTIVLSRIIIRERIGALQWLSIAVSFGGIAWLASGE